MTLSDIIDQVLLLVSGWAGTTLPRVAAAFMGLFVCFLLVVALWERRVRTLTAAFGLMAGLMLIAVSLETGILHALGATTFLTRIRIVMAVLSLGVLIVTIEAIRRSHLQERYALLWVGTCMIILLMAGFPQIFDLFSVFLGTEYTTSVVAIIFVFLLLIGFHFSIAFSGVQKKQTQIAQRCAMLEARLAELIGELQSLRPEMKKGAGRQPSPVCPESVSVPEPAAVVPRRYRGAQVAVPLIIACAVLGVVLVGLLAPQAMIGDEVTHYHMLVAQAERLPEPNFFAEIPTGWGKVETRRYPHVFWWHYIGAVLYKISGGSFAVVQLYQTVFWVQFLIAGYLLAAFRGGVRSRSVILYLIVLGSIPMNLIFSVALYQDVPMAAQILTSFYLLERRRQLPAVLFLVLGLGFKITAILFVPPFLLLSFLWKKKDAGLSRALIVTCISAAVILAAVWHTDRTLHRYADAEYYPLTRIRKLPANIGQMLGVQSAFPGAGGNVETPSSGIRKERASIAREKGDDSRAPVIANHPGDLRIPQNFVVYGGVLLWLTLAAGVVPMLFRSLRKPAASRHNSELWLWGVGLWYLLSTTLVLWSAPDARFFLPGLPFLLLPLAESTVRLPKAKILLSLFASLAVLQAGFVLTKTYHLRQVSPELAEAIEFLERNPLNLPKVFMYPEGNYRLFPVPHEWYLGYRLKEFWKADNDSRIDMLHHFRIGAVVVKKHLIAKVDANINNLGVYPVDFVKDLRYDTKFTKIFENESILIFSVPPPDGP